MNNLKKKTLKNLLNIRKSGGYSKKSLRLLFFIPTILVFIPLLYLAIARLVPDTNLLLRVFISILATIGSASFFLSFALNRKDETITKKELLNEIFLFIFLLILIVAIFWYEYLR